MQKLKVDHPKIGLIKFQEFILIFLPVSDRCKSRQSYHRHSFEQSIGITLFAKRWVGFIVRVEILQFTVEQNGLKAVMSQLTFNPFFFAARIRFTLLAEDIFAK